LRPQLLSFSAVVLLLPSPIAPGGFLPFPGSLLRTYGGWGGGGGRGPPGTKLGDLPQASDAGGPQAPNKCPGASQKHVANVVNVK
jgi:hypothetical protein